MQPLFIAFEGIDGAGTTTQCELLCSRLRAEGHRIEQTREPGGTAIGERIRALLLDPQHTEFDDLTELLLYAASRRQNVVECIRPALSSGKPVISDRYTASTEAYQGSARGLSSELVTMLNDLVTGGLQADAVVFLDLAVELAADRRSLRDGPADGDRLERAGTAFQERVGSAYRSIADRDPRSAIVVDASQPPERVAASVLGALITRFPRFPYR